ncbi:MAG TPA: hypothetical protein QF804_01720, partial [Rhodospirillales bacterium]|nr:hypothetical protein [Rhodospirillales bacterium]
MRRLGARKNERGGGARYSQGRRRRAGAFRPAGGKDARARKKRESGFSEDGDQGRAGDEPAHLPAPALDAVEFKSWRTNQKPRTKTAGTRISWVKKPSGISTSTRARIQQQVRAQDGAAGPDHRNCRSRVLGRLGHGRGGGAQDVEDDEAPVPHGILDVVPEDPEIQHVSKQMQPTAVHEHGGHDRGYRGHRGRGAEQRAVTEQDPWNEPESVHEAGKLGGRQRDLPDKDGHARGDEPDRGHRLDRGRVVVMKRDHGRISTRRSGMGAGGRTASHHRRLAAPPPAFARSISAWYSRARANEKRARSKMRAIILVLCLAIAGAAVAQEAAAPDPAGAGDEFRETQALIERMQARIDAINAAASTRDMEIGYLNEQIAKAIQVIASGREDNQSLLQSNVDIE